MTATPPCEPDARRDTIKGAILVVAQVLPIMAVASLTPAIPQLFQKFGPQVSNPPVIIPMILTVPSLCIAIVSPLMGWLSDRFGRRPVLLPALAAYVFSGIAPMALDDVYAVIGSRAVLGLSEAAIITVCTALIADYFGKRRQKWFAWQGIVASLSGTALLVCGGVFASLSWRGPFAIYLLAVPIAIAAFLYLDEPRRTATSGSTTGSATTPFPWGTITVIAIVTLATSVVYFVQTLNIAVVLNQAGITNPTRVGLMMAVISLGYIAGSFLFKSIANREVKVVLGLALCLVGAGLGGIGLTRGTTGIAISAVINQLGSGMVISALASWSSGLLAFEHRGRGMGIWGTCFFTGMFLCPPLVAFLSNVGGGLHAAFTATGAVAVIGGATSLIAASVRSKVAIVAP